MFLVLAFPSIFFLGCSSDEGSSIDAQLLTDSPWTLTATYGNVIQPLQEPNPFDAYNDLPDCRKDDLYFFEEGGAFSVEKGTEECLSDPTNNDPIVTGTWNTSGENLTLSAPNGLPQFAPELFLSPTEMALLPANFDWQAVIDQLLTNMKVVSLTTSNLELYTETEFSVPVSSINVTIEIQATMEYER